MPKSKHRKNAKGKKLQHKKKVYVQHYLAARGTDQRNQKSFPARRNDC